MHTPRERWSGSTRFGDWRGHHTRDGGDVVVPRLRLAAKRAATGSGEPVELRALLLVGAAPLRFDPAALFHAVKRRIQRAVEHFERAIGSVADEARDGVAVHRAYGQRAKHEHVERALQEIELAERHEDMIRSAADYIKC